MKGGVALFRDTGMASRQYLESDRVTAGEYYLEAGTALVNFTMTDARGDVIAAHPELTHVLDMRGLTLDPVSGEVVELQSFNVVMSKRTRGQARSPLFWR